MQLCTRIRLAICLVLVGLLGYPATSAAVSFGPVTDYPVGHNPAAVAVGDFNGDGKLDLAVANSGSTFVSILLGNGDGTFQTALMADAGGPQSSIVVGDFNGDGKLDIVVNSGPGMTGAPHGVSILLGNGDGTFKAPVQIQTYVNNVLVAAGDFNLDSKLDLVVLEPQFSSAAPAPFLNIFLGKGDGTFQAPTTVSLAGTSAGSLAVEDFNGDGKPDVAAETGNQLSILRGNGDGTFQTAVVTTNSSWVGLSTLLVGDFNGDKKADLATTLTSRVMSCTFFPRICHFINITRELILISNGDGTFQSSVGSSARTSGLALGDVNGDGKLDLMLLQPGGTLPIDLGRGDGTFPVGVPPVVPNSLPTSAAIADLNGDKLGELILVNAGAGTVSVFLNTSPVSGADLSVSFTATANTVLQGQNAVYTAAVVNFGPQDATGLMMTFNLPANSTFVSAVPGSANCTASLPTVICAMGPLVSADAAFATITFTTSVPGTDTVSVSVAANEPDLNPANNMASSTLTVIPTFTLTATKAGAGGTVTDNFGLINCGSTCSGMYGSGTSVNLVAVPDTTSAFANWSGACTGMDPNTCVVTMTAAQSVTATFVSGVTLTVPIAGTGSGTVTSAPPGINCFGGTCTANFATGTTVNLTANASTGSSFTSWSGACTGTNPNSCTVTLSAAQSVTATFSLPADFSLSLAPTLSVASGSNVPDTITVSSQNGALSTPVTFSCAVSPALAQCSFSPSSVTLGATPSTTTLTIVAMKPPGTASNVPQRPGLALFASLWLPIPGLILAGVGFASKHPRKKKMFAGLLLVYALCAGVISQSACGGGSSSGGSTFTPPGQYNVTITATSGSIVHSQTVALTVQ